MSTTRRRDRSSPSDPRLSRKKTADLLRTMRQARKEAAELKEKAEAAEMHDREGTRRLGRRGAR